MVGTRSIERIEDENELQFKTNDNSQALFGQFTKDSKRLITCGKDKAIVIWNILTGEKISAILGSQLDLCQLRLTKDEQFIITLGRKNWSDQKEQGEIRIWDASVPLNKVRKIAYSVDGKFIGICFKQEIIIYNSTDYSIVQQIKIKNKKIEDLDKQIIVDSGNIKKSGDKKRNSMICWRNEFQDVYPGGYLNYRWHMMKKDYLSREENSNQRRKQALSFTIQNDQKDNINNLKNQGDSHQDDNNQNDQRDIINNSKNQRDSHQDEYCQNNQKDNINNSKKQGDLHQDEKNKIDSSQCENDEKDNNNNSKNQKDAQQDDDLVQSFHSVKNQSCIDEYPDYGFSFHPNNQYLFYGRSDYFYIYDLIQKKEINYGYLGQNKNILEADFSILGNCFFVQTDKSLRFYNTSNCQLINDFELERTKFRPIWSNIDSYIILGVQDFVLLLNCFTEETSIIVQPQYKLNQQFNDNTHLVGIIHNINKDSKIIIWDLSTYQQVFSISFQCFIRQLNQFYVIPDTDFALICSANNPNIQVQNIRRTNINFSLHGHILGISQLKLNPNNKQFLSSSFDCTTVIWQKNEYQLDNDNITPYSQQIMIPQQANHQTLIN